MSQELNQKKEQLSKLEEMKRKIRETAQKAAAEPKRRNPVNLPDQILNRPVRGVSEAEPTFDPLRE